MNFLIPKSHLYVKMYEIFLLSMTLQCFQGYHLLTNQKHVKTFHEKSLNSFGKMNKGSNLLRKPLNT